MGDMKKIYLIEFIEYTNGLRNTVHRINNDGNDEYLDVSREGTLVSEDDIEDMKQFGKGLRSMKLVGELISI